MNAIEDNPFSRAWGELGRSLPRPRAILCVSAHWETWGTRVTAMSQPRTIHDFGGFPPELFAVQYPAPGSAGLARDVQAALRPAEVELDTDWGLDHGAWSVLRAMYSEADVPVVQLGLDVTKSPQAHYDTGRALAPLRRDGVLIVGSGNMVHNLFRVVLRGGGVGDFNAPFGLPWALEANALFRRLIDAGDHDALIDYPSLGDAVDLAVPTPEHYLPLLYALALQAPGEAIGYFNDAAVAGSLTMTSFVIGGA
jgi:4,5-DOPA dioxygenase extradiol